RLLRPLALVVPRQRLVLVPDDALLLHAALQRLQRRRGRGLGEHARDAAVLGRLGERVLDVTELGLERVERRALTVAERRLRAVRIVEVQDARLRERRRTRVALRARQDRTARERVLRVAVDVDRAALERGRHERLRCATELERRRVLERRARDLVLGAARQRDDLFLLVAAAARAGRETGEAHARAHQVEEVAARHRIDGRPLVSAGR